MAFPSVVGTPTGTSDTSSTSFTVALPGGIVAGELLLIFMAHDEAGTLSTITQSSGPTFTQIDNAVNGTVIRGQIWARLATGGEGNPVFSSTNSQDVACAAIRVQDHGVTDVTTDIVKGTAATGADAAPNPPNCNPGTAQDFLWLEYFAADDDDDTTPYESANYTPVLQQQSASSTSSCLVAVASRQLNASSENPGVMAMAAVEEWVAQTIAIKPITQQTHTTDSLLKASLDKTHTTDSLLKATFEKSHSTDSFLKATFDSAHLTDSLLKAALDKTHTTDSLLQATFERTHSTDSFLAAGGVDVSHTTDALLEATFDGTHLTDSLLKGTVEKVHTTDSLLSATQERAHFTDSLLKATIEKVHSTDSLLSGTVDKTHSTDSLLKSVLEKTHSTDSLLKATSEKGHSTDSLLSGTVEKAHTTDSYIVGVAEKVHSTDSLLKDALERSHSTDSFLQPPAGENINVQIVVPEVVKDGTLTPFSIAITDWLIFSDADIDPICTVYQATGAGPFVVYDAPVITNRPGATGIYDGQFTPAVIAEGGAPVLYMIAVEVKLGSSQKIWTEVIMAIGPRS